MKTIAIMTMVFLPGTFFAALFALPMLQWGQTDVITGRFWIYWACTLPATALVLLGWMIATGEGRLYLPRFGQPSTGTSLN